MTYLRLRLDELVEKIGFSPGVWSKHVARKYPSANVGMGMSDEETRELVRDLEDVLATRKQVKWLPDGDFELVR